MGKTESTRHPPQRFFTEAVSVLAYYALFAVWTVGAIQSSASARMRLGGILFGAVALVTILLMGLRYEVGGDWETYLAMYDELEFQPLSYALTYTDPLYGVLSWIASQLGLGIYFVNTACAFSLIYGVAALAHRQPNPWLAMATATPYLIIVVGMGYTRQAAAIGVICFTLANASPERVGRMIGGVLVAALFHKTAILFLPIFLAPLIFDKPLYAFLGAVLTVGIGMLVLGGASDDLVTQYVNSDYQSTGAGIRISMNLAAAGAFLLFHKRYDMPAYQRRIWLLCSYLSAASAVGLLVSASSVGVDRLALFLIPLQVVTFAGLPYALSRTGSPKRDVALGVIGYNFIVLFVYLNFATFSWAWLPYRNVITADTTVQRLNAP